MAMDDVQVMLKDVKFTRATTIPKDMKIVFVVSIQRGSGNFEVTFGVIYRYIETLKALC